VKYLLDTNTCIRYLKGVSQNINRRIGELPEDEIAVCSVVKAELFFGAEKSQTAERTRTEQELFLKRFTSLPFDDLAAQEYAYVRAQLEKRGTPIGPNDLMIAAIALTHHLILVTHNSAEFSRVNNLQLEDWEV
jgi:tRNA(fMet)-specific endonuclease VapC